MERRNFVKNIAAVSAMRIIGSNISSSDSIESLMSAQKKLTVSPRAITMWDFSWLERRWPGAGYENWDEALGGLKERGYNAVRIDAYPHLVAEYEGIYREKPDYWKKLLTEKIIHTAKNAAKAKLPLITTECWGIVDNKDWPLLKWDWLKELCELGTITAASTGQWIAIATSNFCGPKFVGMWRDVEWHQKLTGIIKSSAISPEILGFKITKRL